MKTLLTTTASVLFIGSMAVAQDTAMENGLGNVEVTGQELMASNFIGMRLYALDTDLQTEGGVFNAGDGWEDIGEINDLIVSRDGSVQAALVGVGGFLGIGEKDVAIAMDLIAVYSDENAVDYLVVDTTAEVLENAPAFEMPVVEGETDAAAMALDDQMEAEPTADAAMDTTAMDSETALTADDTAMADATVAPVDETATGTDMAAADDTTMGTDTTGEVDTAMDADVPAESWMDNYAAIDLAEVNAENLVGAAVYDTTESNIGEIGELVAGTDAAISGAIVDVGGFIGIGEKPVMIALADMTVMKQIDGEELIVSVDMTQEQLEAMPEFEN